MADSASTFPPLLTASASTPGSLSVADFNKLATAPTGSLLIATGITPLIDFLATPADYAINGLPAMAGKSALNVLTRVVFTVRTGTAAGTLAFTAGNNAATYDNLFVVNGSVSAAVINGFGTIPAQTTGGAGLGVPVASSDFRFRVVTVPTGVTVLQGYVVLSIEYVTPPS